MLDPNEESFQTTLQALSLEYEDNNWIIDYGASRHFSGHALQAFNDLKPSCLSGTAVSATNINHAIHGQGNVNVPSSSGEIKKISSVYYVLGLNQNLLSVGQFTGMGCMVVFNERKCVVVTKLTPCRILATGIHNPGNDLYVLKSVSENLEINPIVLDLPNRVQHKLSTLEVNSLSCPSQIASYSLSDNLKREESASFLDHYPMLQANTTQKISNEFNLWHQRMGHLTFQYLSRLSHQDVEIPNLLPAPSGIRHCDSFHQGKSARDKFLKTATRRATKILELIHSDLCGHLPTKSLGGVYYFITFTDDFHERHGYNLCLRKIKRCQNLNYSRS